MASRQAAPRGMARAGPVAAPTATCPLGPSPGPPCFVLYDAMCANGRNLNAIRPVLDVGELRVSGPVRAGQGLHVSGDLAARAPAEGDHAYVRATLRGDLRAFEALVERHRDVVFRVASR